MVYIALPRVSLESRAFKIRDIDLRLRTDTLKMGLLELVCSKPFRKIRFLVTGQLVIL